MLCHQLFPSISSTPKDIEVAPPTSGVSFYKERLKLVFLLAFFLSNHIGIILEESAPVKTKILTMLTNDNIFTAISNNLS